jgi:hypothetical protein
MKKENRKNSPIKFEKIASYASRPEAEMMAIILKKHGILVLIKSEASGIFGSSAVPPPEGVSLLVPKNDVGKALKILPYRE